MSNGKAFPVGTTSAIQGTAGDLRWQLMLDLDLC